MRTQCTAAILLAAAAAAPSLEPAPRSTPVSFARDVQPILAAHCTICHAPGGPSPMPLVTYEETVRWAHAIKAQALARRMPLWHAARGYGAFSNDPTLSPYELDVLVAWADGKRAEDAGGAAGARSTLSAPAKRGGGGAIAADAVTATVRARTGWITGWDFVPGDPLITSATFTSADGAWIGAWTAGDRAVKLPRESAMRIVSPVRVDVRRRGRRDDETAFIPRPSALQFFGWTQRKGRPPRAPSSRVWTERMACGGTLGPAEVSIIGVRPQLAKGASADIGLERLGGASPVLVGWFRDFDPDYPRIYWLAAPIDFASGARLVSDVPCEVDVLLSARR
jgi:hypothetical protein